MKITNSLIKTYIILFLLIVISCQKEEIQKNPATRTIIAYMAANNDLAGDAFVGLQQMVQGFSEKGVNLIVFIAESGENPQLVEIHPGKEKVVKTYSVLNTADPAVLKEVLQDAVDLYPAQEYGLILWSHGSSWMPNGNGLRSFVNDNGNRMNIPDLANSLPVKFKFILFDACLMGAVEVAYELKDKTDYIIASPTETQETGFPYDVIIPKLLQPAIDYNAVAQTYFDYYNVQQDAYQSATVSVLETQQLTALAAAMKQLCENNPVNMASFDRTSVQRLDVYEEQYVFDLLDFVNKIFPNANKDDFIAQLNKVVLYKYHTPQFIMLYDINTFCGLSCYIPLATRSDLNAYYKTLKWYRDAGLSLMSEP
ncbi:MAG: clostripain-related cysteine peptidase [Candidatus Azobacteroides sp.]|nr:clostripain-related cysteine peptidase [Candidatus Azobacteroides sp.]